MKSPRTLPRSLLSSKTSSPYICNSCLSRTTRRPFSAEHNIFFPSTPPSKRPPPPAPPSSGFAHLSTRRLISLSGPDSSKYLQGVITANLHPATSRTSGGFYAAFLSAQGRVLNDVFIYPDTNKEAAGGGWLIDVDAKEADRLAKHIKRYRLRSKFEVRVVEEGEMDIWSIWNEEPGWKRHGLEGSASGGLEEGEFGCVDSRAPGMGKRLLLRDGKKPEVESEEVGDETAKVRRYLKGVPEGQDELLREVALPQESNIDYMGGIDYRKGCYVGQELTIRTHHTGVVRKRVLPVMLYDPTSGVPKTLEYAPEKAGDLAVENIAPETRIGRVDKKGRSAGKWLNGVGNLGLALCRLEIMTGMSVGGEAPPGGWKTDDEFKLEWGVDGIRDDEVRVKAFVPSWHLNK